LITHTWKRGNNSSSRWVKTSALHHLSVPFDIEPSAKLATLVHELEGSAAKDAW
jgi:hypothetical protein